METKLKQPWCRLNSQWKENPNTTFFYNKRLLRRRDIDLNATASKF